MIIVISNSFITIIAVVAVVAVAVVVVVVVVVVAMNNGPVIIRSVLSDMRHDEFMVVHSLDMGYFMECG